MRGLWTSLRAASLGPTALSGVCAAIFGLGDRGYQKYNAAARRLATRIVDLGAVLVTPLALGDESADGGYDAALRPWVEAVFEASVPRFAPEMVPSPLPAPEPRLKLRVAPAEGHIVGKVGGCGKWRLGQVRKQRRVSDGTGDVAVVVEAKVARNCVITNQDAMDREREVRHVELDFSHDGGGSFEEYVPGDIVHVMPRNRASAVDAFFTLFADLDPQAVVDIDSGEVEAADFLNIELPCSLGDFVAAQLDLSAIPRRRFIERLAAFATDAMQREKLLEFSSAGGASKLVQYAYREKRTILMTLRDFPSARPPLSHLVDMLPALRSRPFSIASSRQAHGSVLHICAAVVKYTTPLRFARVGVCSSLWLAAEVGDTVPIYLEKGRALRFDYSRPAILVGPGTGVAPMRSFVTSLSRKSEPGQGQQREQPFRVLYFGCRHARGDFLYEQEWRDAVTKKSLTRLETAFSRDGPAAEKVYVQDVMSRNAVELWHHLCGEPQGYVYVAGAAGDMPKAVRQCIISAGVTAGGLSQEDAEKFVKRMESTKRLQVECW